MTDEQKNKIIKSFLENKEISTNLSYEDKLIIMEYFLQNYYDTVAKEITKTFIQNLFSETERKRLSLQNFEDIFSNNDIAQITLYIFQNILDQNYETINNLYFFLKKEESIEYLTSIISLFPDNIIETYILKYDDDKTLKDIIPALENDDLKEKYIPKITSIDGQHQVILSLKSDETKLKYLHIYDSECNNSYKLDIVNSLQDKVLKEKLYNFFKEEEQDYKLIENFIMDNWHSSISQLEKYLNKYLNVTYSNKQTCSKIIFNYLKLKEYNLYDMQKYYNYLSDEYKDKLKATMINNQKIQSLIINLNESYIKELIKIDFNFICFYKGNNEFIYKVAQDKGYKFSKSNFSFLKYYIYTGNSEDEIMQILCNNGYIITEDDLKNNSNLAKSKIIMLNAVQNEPKLIKYYEGNNEEIFQVAKFRASIKEGYIVTEEDLIKYPNIAKYSSVMLPAIEHNPNLIEFYTGSKEKVFQLALNKGYLVTEESLKNNLYLASSDSIMLFAIENSPRLIKYYRGKNEKIFQLALNKGYEITEEDLKYNYILGKSKCMMMKAIQKNPSLLKYYSDLPSEDIGDLFLSSRQAVINSYSLQNLNKFKGIVNKIGKFYSAMVFDDLFSNKNLLENFEINDIYNIVKYVYYLDNKTKTNLINIITQNQVEILKKIFNLLSKSSNFDTKLFINIVNNYKFMEELFNNFINGNYSAEDCKLLYQLINKSDNKTTNIKTLEELRNNKKILYEQNEKIINSLDLKEIKNIIFQILCNHSYAEISRLLEESFSSKKIKDLILAIEDKNVKSELEKYLAFVEIIESIITNNNIDNLRKIASNLNQKSLDNDSSIEYIWEEFRDIDIKAKSFYAAELNEKNTDFSSLITKNGEIKREDRKYKPDIDNICGDKLIKDAVDYIELDGITFVTFTHKMNAIGSGSQINHFRHPSLLGKSYICLSAIDDENFDFDNSMVVDENHVTLLFSNLSDFRLIGASNHDIFSEGDMNNINISLGMSNLQPVRNVIKATARYNEYVMYRDGNNNESIYPSAVLVSNNVPNQHEINAAAYLGVPLVKINKEAYKDKINIENKMNEEKNKSLSNYSLKDDYKKIKDKLLQLQQYIKNLQEDEIQVRNAK